MVPRSKGFCPIFYPGGIGGLGPWDMGVRIWDLGFGINNFVYSIQYIVYSPIPPHRSSPPLWGEGTMISEIDNIVMYYAKYDIRYTKYGVCCGL